MLRRWVIPATGAALLLLCGAILFTGQLSEESIRQTIRLTASSSLLLFSAAFAASSLVQLGGRQRWQFLFTARRRLGLAFALSHSVHLVCIVLLIMVVFNGDVSRLGNVTPGAVIYLFIYLMAATSNDVSVRVLGARNWKWLHKSGGYLVFIGLFGSFLRGALGKGEFYYWLYTALGAVLLLLRVTAFWSKRKSSHA